MRRENARSLLGKLLIPGVLRNMPGSPPSVRRGPVGLFAAMCGKDAEEALRRPTMLDGWRVFAVHPWLLVMEWIDDDLKCGGIPKRPTGADCKSAGLRLRWFESTSLHQIQHCKMFRGVDENRRDDAMVRPIRRERIGTRRERGAAPEGRRAGCPSSSTSLQHGRSAVESASLQRFDATEPLGFARDHR